MDIQITGSMVLQVILLAGAIGGAYYLMKYRVGQAEKSIEEEKAERKAESKALRVELEKVRTKHSTLWETLNGLRGDIRELVGLLKGSGVIDKDHDTK